MRNLGEFFGHVVKGVKSDPNAPAAPETAETNPGDANPEPSRVVRRQVQEQEVLTPEGKVVLRRTIIDEVEPPRE